MREHKIVYDEGEIQIVYDGERYELSFSDKNWYWGNGFSISDFGLEKRYSGDVERWANGEIRKRLLNREKYLDKAADMYAKLSEEVAALEEAFVEIRG